MSRTGPKKFVEKICSHTSIGISSRQPTPATPRVVHEAVRRPHGGLDLPAGRGDRLWIIEVETDADQTWVIASGSGEGPKSLKTLVGCPHGGQHGPAGAVEVRGRGQTKTAGRAGDDDAAVVSHYPHRPPLADDDTCGRPLDWPLSQPDQMPAEYGPVWPFCS